MEERAAVSPASAQLVRGKLSLLRHFEAARHNVQQQLPALLLEEEEEGGRRRLMKTSTSTSLAALPSSAS